MATMEAQIETQEDLRTHLQPISRVPIPIHTAAVPSEDKEKLVDLAGAIREGSHRIREATNQIILMLQLLEL